ncbi:MAG: DUF4271 domain-containing protein [Ferruginibacter sp.]
MKTLFSVIILLFCTAAVLGQVKDSVPPAVKDSAVISQPPQPALPVVLQRLQAVLDGNKYLNISSTPVALHSQPHTPVNKNIVFYALAAILLFFGIIKTFFEKYFSTLFRVFFNTSLRQSQLTDQLMQAKIPSLFFNLLFVFSVGFYAYFLLPQSYVHTPGFNWLLLAGCIAVFLIVYAAKYVGIKLLAWITGYRSEGDIYIFIVFLVNKIIGICLLPVIAVLAFSDPSLLKIVIPVSLVFVSILLLFRFMRSYGLLESRLKVNRFHFLLYIFSFEVLPVMVIYKAVSFFILKNG